MARFASFAVISAFLAKPVLAEEAHLPDAAAPTVAYCQEDEVHAPGGAIIQVGERWFRLCARASGTPDWRVIRVTLNPELFPDVAEDYVFWGLRIVSQGSYSKGLKNAAMLFQPAGIRMLGDVPFQVLDNGDYGPNGRPSQAAYIPLHLNVAADGLADYWVHCLSESDEHGDDGSCSLHLRYFDIKASLGLYFGLSPESPRQSLDDFNVPELPSLIRSVLAVADITGSVDDWVGRLPVDE